LPLKIIIYEVEQAIENITFELKQLREKVHRIFKQSSINFSPLKSRKEKLLLNCIFINGEFIKPLINYY
jgi:hypothetical protein